jgi:hypothetical protein
VRDDEEWASDIEHRLERFQSATVVFFFLILGNGHTVGDSLAAQSSQEDSFRNLPEMDGSVIMRERGGGGGEIREKQAFNLISDTPMNRTKSFYLHHGEMERRVRQALPSPSNETCRHHGFRNNTHCEEEMSRRKTNQTATNPETSMQNMAS